MSENSDKFAKAENARRILSCVGKVLISAICLWLVFILAFRGLGQLAITQIAEISGTKIGVESVDFNYDGSVFIEKLVVRPYQSQGYDDRILTAEKVYARFGLLSLILLRPRLKEIRVNDFVFNAQQDLETGRWNIAALKIRPSRARFVKMPLVQLQNGTLKYSKVSGGEVRVAATIKLNGEFGPAEEPLRGYSFEITTVRESGAGESKLTGLWQPGGVTLAGGISSAELAEFGRVLSINVLAAELNYDRSNSYGLKLRINDLVCAEGVRPGTFALESQSFLEKSGLFAGLEKFFNRYLPRGQLDIELEASGNLEQLSESELWGEIYCKDVYICDRKHPYPMEHITGRIDISGKGLSLENLSGLHKDVMLFFNGRVNDFGPDYQYEIQVTSDNMALDNDLYNALGTKQKKFWSSFSPSGFAAINYHLSRRSQTDKKRTLAVELLGAEAKYRRFPYPLTNLSGKLLFARGSITISDVVSELNERKVSLNGKVGAYKTDRPIYDISIVAENIPLDSTLSAALQPGEKHLYDRLDMNGLAEAEVKIFTPEEDNRPASFIAKVRLKESSFSAGILQRNRKGLASGIDESSLVVSEVSARAEFSPDLIRIDNLTGRFSGGKVFLSGRIRPGQSADELRYSLSINSQQIGLSDGLFSLLPGPLEKVVSELQLEGKINCSADLDKAGRSDRPDYKIVIDCLGDRADFKRFGYPLKDITGKVTVTSDGIKLEDIAATVADNVEITPGASKIQMEGQIGLVDNGFGDGSFRLWASDIFFDERLGIGLPKKIRDFYFKLSPTGRFDLKDVKIKISKTDTGEKDIDFEGEVELKNCNFNTSPAISELGVELRDIKGSYKIGEGLSKEGANLTGGTLQIKGKLLTGLEGSVFYDPGSERWLGENLIAECYDGRLIAKFELKEPTDGALEYLLQAGFDSIDLKQFLEESKAEEGSVTGHTSGRMSGSLSVKGRLGDGHSRLGRCRLTITDMQVGRVSPLAKLLDILRLTEPKDFAFNKMVVDSYLRDDSLFLEEFDLSGESVAFNGSGWMDLRSGNVDLTLTARGRRLVTAEPSILQSLTEGLGQGVVRMDVTGDIYDPQVTTKALPVIEGTLQLLGTAR